MPTDDDALLDALELGSLATPMSPGRTWRVEIPGVFVRDSAIASPRTNQVALTRLGPDTVDDTIARVKTHFGPRPFAWNVGPRCTPANLEARLDTAGLVRFRESGGLALRDLATPIDAPAISLRRATLDDAEALAAIGTTMFDQEPSEALWIQQLVLSEPRLEVWLAVDGDEVLGFGQSYVTPDRLALLVGAATLPHARGRGIYRALLRHRIDIARARGATAAIIQANDTTSGPICRALGFVEICRLTLWLASAG